MDDHAALSLLEGLADKLLIPFILVLSLITTPF